VHAGVCGIPPSSFYSAENKALAKDYVRFAFCKDDADINEAMKRLKENVTLKD
jgi:aspartate/methionine/tyrosine aminotransferase